MAQHRDRRGAPRARRDDSRGPRDAWCASWGGREYRAIFEGGATPPPGMHRRSNAGVSSTTGCYARAAGLPIAMITVYSDRHRLHHGTAELIDGVMQPCFEKPQRAEMILARVREAGLGEVIDAGPVDLDAVRRVHDPRYVDFLSTAWEEWTAQGRSNDALPLVWPVPAVRHDRIPHNIDGKLGYFSMDAGVPITAGTWEAVTAGAAVALERGGPDRRRRGQRLRPVPAARAPRRRGDDGRLLLPEQRRHRRPVPARPRLCPRGGARRRLPPRQRHPEHLLRPARRAVRVAPRRPVGRVSVLPRLRRRGGRRGRRGLHPQLPDAARHSVGHLRRGAGRRLRQDRRLRPRRGGGVARRRHLRARPDLRASGSPSRTTRGSGRGSPRSAGRRCS